MTSVSRYGNDASLWIKIQQAFFLLLVFEFKLHQYLNETTFAYTLPLITSADAFWTNEDDGILAHYQWNELFEWLHQSQTSTIVSVLCIK